MHLNLFLKNLAVISSFIIYSQKSKFGRTGKIFQERKRKKIERTQENTIFPSASESNENGSVTDL